MRVRKYFEKGTGEEREEMLLSRTEQEAAYQRCLQEVLNNPRKVLDSLEYREEFRVGWKAYRKRKDGLRSGQMLSKIEQEVVWQENLSAIIENPGWFLDKRPVFGVIPKSI